MRVSNSSLGLLTNEVDERSETEVSWLLLVGGRERLPQPALLVVVVVVVVVVDGFDPARLEERPRQD